MSEAITKKESKLREILQGAQKDKKYFKGLNKQMGNENKTKMDKIQTNKTKLDKNLTNKIRNEATKRIN